jgi:phage tail sheath gpL-like
MSIGFSTIPGAGLVAPLLAFEVNSGGQFEAVSRLFLLGHKTTAGTLADNAVSVCGSQAEADALAGPGSMLREMFRVARALAPAQEIWIQPVPATGVAQTWTLTVGAPPAAGGVGTIDIAGERIAVQIAAGDAAATVAATLNAAINAYFNALTGAMLPVISSVAAAVVTVTARHAGAIFSDLDFYIPTEVGGNAFVPAGRLTVAAGTAGTGAPTLTTALANIGDTKADLIISPFADTTNLDGYQTMMSDVSGRWSSLRQVYGHFLTVNTGNTGAHTTLGLARNDRHCSTVGRYAGAPEPAWLWAAATGARVMPWLSDYVLGKVSANQTGLSLAPIRPPRDRTTWPNYPTRNTLNAAGISTWEVGPDGYLTISKLVTGYRLGTSGQPDTVFRDIQAMFQVQWSLSYMRERLAVEQGNKAIADSNPGNLQTLTTIRDIKATFVHAYEELARRGILENAEEFSRKVVVRRNSGNANRVDVFAPLDRVNPLDILAVNATIYAQYSV